MQYAVIVAAAESVNETSKTIGGTFAAIRWRKRAGIAGKPSAARPSDLRRVQLLRLARSYTVTPPTVSGRKCSITQLSIAVESVLPPKPRPPARKKWIFPAATHDSNCARVGAGSVP